MACTAEHNCEKKKEDNAEAVVVHGLGRDDTTIGDGFTSVQNSNPDATIYETNFLPPRDAPKAFPRHKPSTSAPAARRRRSSGLRPGFAHSRPCSFGSSLL